MLARRWTYLLAALVSFGPIAMGADAMKFWNTTSREFTGVYLAPAGTLVWGGNQTANDADGSVSGDERLRLTNVEPGRYDVKLIEKSGRVCMVTNVAVIAGGRYAFTIAERDLSHCVTEAKPAGVIANKQLKQVH